MKELHTVHSFLNQDLLDQVEDVWRKGSDKFQSIFEQMEGWDVVPVPARPIPTPSVPIGLWQNGYIFHIFCKSK